MRIYGTRTRLVVSALAAMIESSVIAQPGAGFQWIAETGLEAEQAAFGFSSLTNAACKPLSVPTAKKLAIGAGSPRYMNHLDNPLPLGTSGGSNARTGVFHVPYIYGNGDISIRWRQDLSMLPGGAAPPGRGAIVFDENGDLYWRSQSAVAVPGVDSGGIVKTRASDGATLWRSPVLDGAALTTPPIIGTDAVYASRARGSLDPSPNNVVYALDKSSGNLLWTSPSLPAGIVLGMALQDGYLYGATQSVGGTAWAYCIRALDGVLKWSLPVQQPVGASSVMNVTLVPDVFETGQHLLCWMYEPGSPAMSGLTAVRASSGTGTFAWSGRTNRTSISHILYNQKHNVLYATHWNDYGTTIDAYKPATGSLNWIAGPGEFGGSFNGGFIPAHTLRPDGEGLIFGGFAGDIWSITDPGDLSGGALGTSAIDWYFDGADLAGEPGTNAVTIADPSTGDQVYVAGTYASVTPQYSRRLVAMRVNSPSPAGERLWEWLRPNDPAPTSSAGNFRSLSVGPDGTLYYFDRSDGATGSLIALGNCAVNVPTVTPQSSSVCTGGQAVFSVNAGFYPVSYRWQKNGVDIDVNTNPSAATTTLTISDITPLDAGSYTCAVVNACGTQTSISSTLNVENCCPSDLNGDLVVDDSDFVLFAFGYNILDCTDPTMPAGCPADLNNDAIVEDADFVIFASAYNDLLCP